MLRRSLRCLISATPDAVGLTLAFGFVGTAAAMGVLAYTGGEWPRTFPAALMLASALLANVTLALGPLITLGRRRGWAAAVMCPLWVLCAAMSYQSITKFCAERLLDTEAMRDKASDDYKAASDIVRSKRTQRAQIDEVRGVAALEAQIAGLMAKPLRSGGTVGEITKRCTTDTWRVPDTCAEANDLASALAVSRKRDAVDTEITQAIEARSRYQPIASGAASGRLMGIGAEAGAEIGGLIGLVRRSTGIDVRTGEELRAVSLALLIWLGELLMPIAVSLARGQNAPLRNQSGADAEDAVAPRRRTADYQGIDLVETWFRTRAVANAQASSGAGELYDDFLAWCAAEGAEAISVGRFGAALGQRPGISRRKAGHSNRVRYFGVVLRRDITNRHAVRPVLVALAGGPR